MPMADAPMDARMGWRRIVLVGLGLVLGVAVSGPAGAQRGQGQDGPCKEDIPKHCKGVERSKMLLCLESKQSELSEKCAATVKKRLARRTLLSECQGDIASYCSEHLEAKNSGQIKICLEEHKEKLSAGCAGMLPKAHRVDASAGGKAGQKGEGKGKGTATSGKAAPAEGAEAAQASDATPEAAGEGAEAKDGQTDESDDSDDSEEASPDS